MNATYLSSKYFHTSFFIPDVLGENHRQLCGFKSAAAGCSNSPGLRILTSVCQEPSALGPAPRCSPPAPLSPTCPLTRSYSLWDAPWFCCGPSLQEEVNKPYFVWLQGCFVQVFGLDFHMWKEVREQRVENRSYIRHLQMLATRNQQYKCAKSR